MKNLISYFNVLLNSSTISDTRVYSFGLDHLGKLKTNNPGQRYDAMISTTEALLAEFYTKAVDKERSRALREGSTANVTELRDEAERFISRQEGAIRSIFGKDSQVYQEFYPHGITEYRQAPLDHFSDLLDMFIRAVEAHAAELPPQIKTEIVGLRDRYREARNEQINHKGSVSGAISIADASREAVCLQLTRNVLAIASDNLGKPDECSRYFNQSIVQSRRTASGNEIIEGEPEPGEKFLVKQGGFNPETIFIIENDGSIPLKFYTADDPTANVPDTAVEILPGEVSEYKAVQMGAAANNNLMCYNPSHDHSASFISKVKEKVK